MGQAELIGKGTICTGFFDRVEIGALNIFDQRKLKLLLRRRLLDDHRYRLKARAPGGTPATLAGDQLVITTS
jgi:hypothetical protein